VELEPSAERVVRVHHGDAPHLRPRLRDGERGGDPVGRQDVGHAEEILRVGHLDLEQLVDAALGHDGQQLQLLDHWADGELVVGGDDAREVVDLLDELHALDLFHRRLGAGRLIRRDGLDPALAEEPGRRVDLLGGQRVASE
jgi:hypothetical protein